MIVVVADPDPSPRITVVEGAKVVVRPERQIVRVATAAGPQGPAGPPGDSAPVTHVQSAPAAAWIISHNLGRIPQVTVLNDAGELVLADVAHSSLTSLTVIHAAPRTGAAHLL